MRKTAALFLTFLMSANLFSTENPTKIKLSFDEKEVVVRMENNSAVEQFLKMLPAKFRFEDFAGEEKISRFPQTLNLKTAPRGMVASRGKMFIYAPWGNFGIFYKNHGNALDKNLIPLGEVESGLENLNNQKENFSAKIEIIK